MLVEYIWRMLTPHQDPRNVHPLGTDYDIEIPEQ